MVSTDPIADMCTRIRNASSVNKNEVSLPYSKIKESVAQILVDNGFLMSISVDEKVKHKQLHITIFPESGSPAFTEIARLSKPGRRVYNKSDQIPAVKRGRGIVIISTSKGMMTGQDAKNNKLGGELICEVY